MKLLRKYCVELLITVMGFIQCLAFFDQNVFPSWIYSLDLIFLIMLIIMMKLNQMENNLKNRY